jgi:hypothetical protein
VFQLRTFYGKHFIRISVFLFSLHESSSSGNTMYVLELLNLFRNLKSREKICGSLLYECDYELPKIVVMYNLAFKVLDVEAHSRRY